MPAYDGLLYSPPAPIAQVVLRQSTSETLTYRTDLLIDTGADVTLLPQASIEPLGLRPIPQLEYELIGFDGSKSVAESIELDLIFLGKVFRGHIC